jgi:hypothetical protein
LPLSVSIWNGGKRWPNSELGSDFGGGGEPQPSTSKSIRNPRTNIVMAAGWHGSAAGELPSEQPEENHALAD